MTLFVATPPVPVRPGRPLGVAILAILIILAGVLLTLLSLLALVVGVAVIPIIGTIGVVIFGLAFILSLILLLAGLGLWRLRPWAWWLALFVLLVYIANQVGSIYLSGGFGAATTGQLIAIGFPVLVFIYLLAVRGSFRASLYPR